MTKPYLDINQQIDNLSKNKGLIIPDPTYARKKLSDISYFSLIGGYKTPFINPMTRQYEGGATFDDIVALYEFDKSLRVLTFGALVTVEEKIRQLITDAFCRRFGANQSAFLDPHNYNSGKKDARKVSDLTNRYLKNAVNDTQHDYINYQRKTNGNVPLWAASRLLTFGSLSKMYSVLQIQQRTAIANAFPVLSEKELSQSLDCLTYFRNVCAHNERLYSFKLHQRAFPDTPLHKKMHIPQKGIQYQMGKTDYFAVVISLCYLLPRKDFLTYKASLKHLINSYLKKNLRITKADLLNRMGMPLNWDSITRYKLS